MTDSFTPSTDHHPIFSRETYEYWLSQKWGTDDQQKRYRQAVEWWKRHEDEERMRRLEEIL